MRLALCVAAALLSSCAPKPSCVLGFTNTVLPTNIARGRPAMLTFLTQTSYALVASVKSGGIPGLSLSGFSLVGTPTTDGQYSLEIEVSSEECDATSIFFTVEVKKAECDDDIDCRQISETPCTSSTTCTTVAFPRACAQVLDGEGLCIDRVPGATACGTFTEFATVTSTEGTGIQTCLIEAKYTCRDFLCQR